MVAAVVVGEVGATDCANCFLLISLMLKRGRGILLATVESMLTVEEGASDDDEPSVLSTAVVGKVVNISLLNFRLGKIRPECEPAAVVGASVTNFG